MNKMTKAIAVLGIGMIFFTACNNKDTAKEEKPPVLDMKDFFKDPVKAGLQVSPDGNYLSYRAQYKGRMNLFVQKLDDTTSTVRVTSDTSRSIFNYFWKADKIVYLQDIGGDENFQLFIVDKDGKNTKSITPFPKVRTDVIDALENNDSLMIVGVNKLNPEVFDPYSVNVFTGEMKMLYKNPGNITGWNTDHDGKIRMATTSDGVNTSVLYRATDQDTFKTIATTNFKETFAPLFFTSDNKNVYVLSNIGKDKSEIVEYDPVSKKEVKVIASNKDYDMAGLSYSEKKKAIVAANYIGERQEFQFFDDEYKEMFEKAKKDIGDYDFFVSNNNKNEDKFIIVAYGDKAAYHYLYDKATGKFTLKNNGRPWLKEEWMANMKPIQYTTRDGIVIHGYLTLPKGVEAKNLPVVVNPHGGPWARDQWGLNPEVQFLANRGYAVLQMNFRGSTGYGRAFWERSFKEWGKKMQDDITDGVRWLIKEGIADSSKIAIYGGSYGGYATLAGVTFTPDLYAAAVDYVGVANMFTFMKTIPPYWKPQLDMLHEMAGDPVKDSLLLAEASPALHADQIKTPLFIAQGANDPRVNKNESDQMVAALQKRGVQVEYMVKNDEGHGFHNENNKFDFYGAMEKFLDKHLKQKKEAMK